MLRDAEREREETQMSKASVGLRDSIAKIVEGEDVISANQNMDDDGPGDHVFSNGPNMSGNTDPKKMFGVWHDSKNSATYYSTPQGAAAAFIKLVGAPVAARAVRTFRHSVKVLKRR